MELRQLQYFAAVARHRSFTRAAEELYVTQPALSQQVRRLEAELGLALLTRGSSGGRGPSSTSTPASSADSCGWLRRPATRWGSRRCWPTSTPTTQASGSRCAR